MYAVATLKIFLVQDRLFPEMNHQNNKECNLLTSDNLTDQNFVFLSLLSLEQVLVFEMIGTEEIEIVWFTGLGVAWFSESHSSAMSCTRSQKEYHSSRKVEQTVSATFCTSYHTVTRFDNCHDTFMFKQLYSHTDLKW